MTIFRRVLGLVLALSLLSVASAADAEPIVATDGGNGGPNGRPDFLPEIADSAGLTTEAVASGSVSDASGRPVAGTAVVLVAWPSDQAMSAMVPGDSFNLVPVAKATTDPAGRYELRIPDAAALAPLAADDGAVDLEVVAYTSAGPTAFSFPRRLVGSGASRRLEMLEGNEPVGSRPKAPTARADLRVGAGAVADTGAVTAVADDTALDKACTSTLQSTYSPIWDLVGQLYITTSGVKGTFTYSSGAQSELGVGYSTSGNYGSFSASGTSTKSSTGLVTFPTLNGTGNRYYDTQFRYGKYRVSCVDAHGFTTIWYEARVANWVGGSRVRTLSSAPSASFCTSFAAGSVFEKDTSAAITWSNGAATSSAIGLSLSTKTGYTTTSKLKFEFTSSKRLCGTNGDPGATPRQLVAKT